MRRVSPWSVALLLASAVAWLPAAACGEGRRERVRFDSGSARLEGTLFRPAAEGPVPAVVLIHGSGPEDRGSLRPWAELLVRQGFAALAYDKRGVGRSTGDKDAWREFSLDDLAADAAAGVELLAGRDDVDTGRIGLLGVSQGGWVAPLAASRSPHVSFLILVSPSVTTVAADRLFERAARLRHEGFTAEEIAEVTAMQLVDQELTRSGQGFGEFSRLWSEHRDKRWFRRVYLSDDPVPGDHRWRRWYRTVLDFDPLPLLAAQELPVLALFGDPALDRLAPVEQSVANLERLRETGKDVGWRVLEGADHALRLTSGRPAPYEQALAEWLRRLR